MYDVYKHVCMYINGIVIFMLFLVLKLINHVRSFQGWLQTKIFFKKSIFVQIKPLKLKVMIKFVVLK